MKILLYGFLRTLVLAVDALAVVLAFLCLIVVGAASLAGVGIYSGWRLLRR